MLNSLLGRYNFSVRHGSVSQVPEPASALGLLAIGALGTTSLLKQKLSQEKRSKQDN
jgi:hypothetical protein